MIKNREINSFQVWEQYQLLIERMNFLTKSERLPPAFGYPANALYDFVQEIIDDLIFLVSSDHFRSAKKNPGIKFFYDLADPLGNPLSIKVKFPRRIAGRMEAEVKGLFLIKEGLLHLKRHRHLKRWTNKLMSTPLPSTRNRKRRKRTQHKRRKYPWWYVK